MPVITEESNEDIDIMQNVEDIKLSLKNCQIK